jgi:hypothetical protein
LDQLYRDAAVAQRSLANVTNEVAQAVGGQPLIPSTLKGRGRAAEKIAANYGGDASRITDLARASVVVERPEQIAKVVGQIRARCKVVQMKDRFAKPLSGYRDMLFTVEMPNGHVAELQVQLKAIQQLKEGEGHRLYEAARSIRARAELESRALTAEERKELSSIEGHMRGLYESAFASASQGEGGSR